ncbi:GNAT family N-acetyltransferase [Ancrocorticia populi]|uniref:N-acetyltransferase n=1 Tax=Ancrocorticia populi TaxID=2175228 RepID=A0A2V1KAL8_9ACTO|nr:GNAT family protein [Ancrocorticia populi]PWF27360.1 N-acetyltransferase [Ancrocorticia populi]
MSVTLVPFQPEDPADREAFVDFMTSNYFPFHVLSRPSADFVEKRITEGAYTDDDHATYWLEKKWKGRLGLVIFEDLNEDAPLFDVRLSEAVRGQGLGVECLKAIADFAFSTMPEISRLEGQTREDNVPMRRVFESARWVQEAYYREAWPVEGGDPVASVAYAILRRDWEHGTVTPLNWR